MTFLVPAFGVAWGALFLAEPLAPGTLLAAALVLVSVGLVLDMRGPWPPWRIFVGSAPGQQGDGA